MLVCPVVHYLTYLMSNQVTLQVCQISQHLWTGGVCKEDNNLPHLNLYLYQNQLQTMIRWKLLEDHLVPQIPQVVDSK